MNEYYFGLAKRSAEIVGEPIRAEWIYCQWSHETAGFTSELCVDYNNFGGITTSTPNDLPQPDGSMWYRKFESPEDYAEYFGRYLRLYEEDGIYNSTDISSYAAALKHGGYFGDTLENYITGMTAVYQEEFSC
jgi:hypothetical protein